MPDMIPQVGRSSLVRGMCRSICIMFSGMVSSSGFQSRFFVLANETQDAGLCLSRQA